MTVLRCVCIPVSTDPHRQRIAHARAGVICCQALELHSREEYFLSMTKCGGCARFLSLTNAARRQKCSAVYHRRCVTLPASGNISTSWQCPECKKNQVTDNKPETPVRGSGSYTLDSSETPMGNIQKSASSPKNPCQCTHQITADIRHWQFYGPLKLW